MAGIYLHIPFCKQACSYCDFHFSTVLDTREQLVEALKLEIKLRRTYLGDEALQSIYFGGGTPSLLSNEQLSAIMEVIKTEFITLPDAEVTLETNPDDIEPSRLEIWKKMGINRLSIGLQSFKNEELRWMNRAHTAEESLVAVKKAQAAGFNNITIDLIYGSRFQNLDTWVETVKTALDLGVQHISAYQLTVEDRTKLGHAVRKGTEPIPSDQLTAEQFLYLSGQLTAAGFEHYEISNFALPGHRALHNSNYWLQSNYLGLGPSAHSFNGSSRQWNVRNNPQYIKEIAMGNLPFEKEELSARDLYNEYVMTRFRTTWGCDAEEIKNKFGETISQHFLQMVKVFREQLNVQNSVYTLKTEARLQADGIASAFFILEESAN